MFCLFILINRFQTLRQIQNVQCVDCQGVGQKTVGRWDQSECVASGRYHDKLSNWETFLCFPITAEKNPLFTFVQFSADIAKDMLTKIMLNASRPFSKSVEQGAATSVYVAVAPELQVIFETLRFTFLGCKFRMSTCFIIVERRRCFLLRLLVRPNTRPGGPWRLARTAHTDQWSVDQRFWGKAGHWTELFGTGDDLPFPSSDWQSPCWQW